MLNNNLNNNKGDRLTPVQRSLHWLLVCQRIDFKILLLVYNALNGICYVMNHQGSSGHLEQVETKHEEAVFRFYALQLRTAGLLQLSASWLVDDPLYLLSLVVEMCYKINLPLILQSSLDIISSCCVSPSHLISSSKQSGQSGLNLWKQNPGI